MKVFAKLALAAAAAAIVIPAGAADGAATVYGRAGGTVADQRIQQIANSSTRDSVAASEFDTGLGRAGGPAAFVVAKSVTTDATREQTVAAVSWYGRAGRPLPFGG